MSRIAQLPRSYQLNLAGETQFLQQARQQLQAAVPVDHDQHALRVELSGKVLFRSENYIESVDETAVQAEQFDVVLCLSTVKWVHLNFGDCGVKALFLKVQR